MLQKLVTKGRPNLVTKVIITHLVFQAIKRLLPEAVPEAFMTREQQREFKQRELSAVTKDLIRAKKSNFLPMLLSEADPDAYAAETANSPPR